MAEPQQVLCKNQIINSFSLDIVSVYIIGGMGIWSLKITGLE
jgi:hypothetical protein